MSRTLYPKQLLALMGAESLLQQTAHRIAGHAGFAPPLIIANEEHRFIIAEQLLEIDIQPQALMLEPFGGIPRRRQRSPRCGSPRLNPTH